MWISVSKKFTWILLWIVIFTLYFYALSQKSNHFNIGKLSMVNSFYFTTNAIGTIGFGDIFPISSTAKLSVCVMLLIFLYILFHEL